LLSTLQPISGQRCQRIDFIFDS